MIRIASLPALLLLKLVPAMAGTALVPATLEDFHLSGTQFGDANADAFYESDHCAACHQVSGQDTSPVLSWRGSKMAQAGRNPLFFAQLATANQDVANAGYYCLRCHVPKSIISGNALQLDESGLSQSDRQGVDCHFCHSLADPIYRPDESPLRDLDVLSALESVPEYYANAMFVVDPDGVRRGTRPDASPYHEREISPFHTRSAICGSCHDVGNVAVSRQPDGSYRYNALDTPPDSENPWMQFPLERTYTEWQLSEFADGGVDMGGRFGGDGVSVVSSCQDCHMPRSSGHAAVMGPVRDDLRSHEFAGSSVWTLDIIGRHFAGDPGVDQEALAVGMERSRDMLGRAVTLSLDQGGGVVHVRLFNETGHKLPTGHIEGRRAWLNVRVRNADGQLLADYGGYDPVEALLDSSRTVVYEMTVGLSADASDAIGLPAGPTGHMALADTIVKDTRIPPRGFDRVAFEQAGAPVVGRDYADDQYWDDAYFRLPDGAAQVEATAYYQTATRHYIEELHENNHSDDWGEILYQLWNESGRSPPEIMGQANLAATAFLRADFDLDGSLGPADALAMIACFDTPPGPASRCLIGDLTGDGQVACDDFTALAEHWDLTSPMPHPAACAMGVASGAWPVPMWSAGIWTVLMASLFLLSGWRRIGAA